MSTNPSRRDFLKISSATILGAGIAGLGLRRIQDNITPGEAFARSATEGAPNIIWIVLDTVRARSLSLYGYQRATTPNLERIARYGTTFDRAFAPASWTLQSHASMFTGRRPFQLSADWDIPLDSTYPTIAETYRMAGYDTAGFIANYYFLSPGFGLDRGFDHYEDYRLTPGRAFLSTSIGVRAYYEGRFFEKFEKNNSFGNKNAKQIRLDFLRWFDQREKSKPYFAFMNFIDAHAPYLPPSQFVTRFTNNKPIAYLPADGPLNVDPSIIQGLQDAYDGEIAYLDDQLGILFDELDQRGQLNNTILVISSDHGEHLGEHGLVDHGNSHYLPLLQVPLLMIFPTAIPVSRISTPVSLRNIAATLIDLSGMTPAEVFPGHSLAKYWREPGSESEIVWSESSLKVARKNQKGTYTRSTSLIYHDLHYIRTQQGFEELFDLREDPNEEESIINVKNRRSDVETFRLAFQAGSKE